MGESFHTVMKRGSGAMKREIVAFMIYEKGRSGFSLHVRRLRGNQKREPIQWQRGEKG